MAILAQNNEIGAAAKSRKYSSVAVQRHNTLAPRRATSLVAAVAATTTATAAESAHIAYGLLPKGLHIGAALLVAVGAEVEATSAAVSLRGDVVKEGVLVVGAARVGLEDLLLGLLELSLLLLELRIRLGEVEGLKALLLVVARNVEVAAGVVLWAGSVEVTAVAVVLAAAIVVVVATATAAAAALVAADAAAATATVATIVVIVAAVAVEATAAVVAEAVVAAVVAEAVVTTIVEAVVAAVVIVKATAGLAGSAEVATAVLAAVAAVIVVVVHGTLGEGGGRGGLRGHDGGVVNVVVAGGLGLGGVVVEDGKVLDVTATEDNEIIGGLVRLNLALATAAALGAEHADILEANGVLLGVNEVEETLIADLSLGDEGNTASDCVVSHVCVWVGDLFFVFF